MNIFSYNWRYLGILRDYEQKYYMDDVAWSKVVKVLDSQIWKIPVSVVGYVFIYYDTLLLSIYHLPTYPSKQSKFYQVLPSMVGVSDIIWVKVSCKFDESASEIFWEYGKGGKRGG